MFRRTAVLPTNGERVCEDEINWVCLGDDYRLLVAFEQQHRESLCAARTCGSVDAGHHGMSLEGDIGGPMDVTNEYRRNVPVLTYGFDQSFVDYFSG